MFGTKAQRDAYESIIGHLKDEIERLTMERKDLLDRLMAKNFGEYQVMKDPENEVDSPWPIIPSPGTVAPYEADVHETS